MSFASSSATRTELGRQAEAYVGAYLENQGYDICEYNYAIRGGEVDVIARRGTTFAFVEVKFRQSNYFALHTIITPSKQRKIYKTARYYIACQKYYHGDFAYRFDVAFVYMVNGSFHIEYLENAFVPESVS
jgi:uncharacterized protein (TIGR00252 family)